MSSTRHLLVIGTLALGALPTGQLVVEDTSTGERLGEAFATVTPFRVGEDRVVFAGPRESPEHHMMVLVVPGEHGGTTPYPVKGEGWMSQPVRYTPGMVITAIGQDREGRELFRLEGPPIRPNAEGVLRPMLGPGWVQYGPKVE
jgi:hypothetical protein